MSKASSLRWLVVSTVAAVIVLGAAAVRYERRFSDIEIQRQGNMGTVVTAVVGLVGLFVLTVYTWETSLLRRAQEQQTENLIKPVLRFDLSSKERGLAMPMDLAAPSIKNVGKGPAFNISVSPLVSDGVKVDMDGVPLIEANGEVGLTFSISQDGQYSGMSRQISELRYLIEGKKLAAPITVDVECDGLSRKHYRTSHEIRYYSYEKRVQTKFLGISEL